MMNKSFVRKDFPFPSANHRKATRDRAVKLGASRTVKKFIKISNRKIKCVFMISSVLSF